MLGSLTAVALRSPPVLNAWLVVGIWLELNDISMLACSNRTGETHMEALEGVVAPGARGTRTLEKLLEWEAFSALGARYPRPSLELVVWRDSDVPRAMERPAFAVEWMQRNCEWGVPTVRARVLTARRLGVLIMIRVVVWN